MIYHGRATGRIGLRTRGVNSVPRIIANKNNPLNLYILDFFLRIGLPSVELEGRVGRKVMASCKREEV